MKLDALDHPKTLDFAARLVVTRPTAIGHLELFWAFVGKLAPQGNVGKFADGAIARASEWQGDPAEFVDALIGAGFLDEDREHRLLVHDWHDHCPRWVSAKLKKLGISFLEPTAVSSAVATAVATTVPSPCARASPGEGKAGEGKRVRTHAAVPTAVPTPEGNGDRTPGQQSAELRSEQELHEAFAAVKEGYPHKAGRLDWMSAEHHWRIRLEEGATVEELLAGVQRYSKFVVAGGVSSDRYVLGPEKFFSAADRPWAQDWRPPAVATTAQDTRRDELLARIKRAGATP